MVLHGSVNFNNRVIPFKKISGGIGRDFKNGSLTKILYFMDDLFFLNMLSSIYRPHRPIQG